MPDDVSIDRRLGCPECGSKTVEFYGSGMFYLDREGVPHLVESRLEKEPDGYAHCECGWEGQRCDLVDPPSEW